MLPMSLNTPAQSLIILVNSRHEALAIVVLVKGPRMTPTVVPFLLGPRRVRGAGWCIMCMGPSLDLTKRQVFLQTCFIFLVSPQSTAACQYVINFSKIQLVVY